MMNSQNKFIFGVVALAFSLSTVTYAQTSFSEQDQQSEPSETENIQGIDLSPYFGTPNLPVIDRDQATGKPLVITPGPYLTEGEVADDPFRVAPQEPPADVFYEDGNQFDVLFERQEEQNTVDGEDVFNAGISEGELAEIDPATLGLLEEHTGGMPYDMWHGSSYEGVINVIAKLPVATSSPTINSLSELLLISAAAVPPRLDEMLEFSSPQDLPLPLEGGDAANDRLEYEEPVTVDQFIFGGQELEQEEVELRDNSELLLARLNRLSQTGKVSLLLNFLNGLPQDIELPEYRKLRIDTALLSGDTLSACNMARDARAQDGGTYWLKVLTYCRAVDGDRSGAAFNVSLLRETGEAPDYFTSLIEDIISLSEGGAVNNYALQRVTAEQLDPLSIAMINTAKQELPLYILGDLEPLLLGSMTRRADLSIDFRVEVSELASLYGVIDGKVFSEVLAAMEFTDGERDSIFLLANSDIGARVDGLLINSAMYEPDRLRQAELISTAYERGLRQKLLPALSYPLLDVVKTITPTADLAHFAHDAGRISLYSGDSATATKWFNLVRGMSAENNFEANRSLVSLWPLMAISDQENQVPVNDDIIAFWQQSLGHLSAKEQQKRMNLLFALLDVFGHTLSQEAWLTVFNLGVGEVEVGAMPSHAGWRAFLQSARRGNVGETLSLGLMVLGSSSLDQVNVSVLTSVLSVLRAMGLEDEARAIAIEVLVGNGF